MFIDIKFGIGTYVWLIRYNVMNSEYYVINHSFEIIGYTYENYKGNVEILYRLFDDIYVSADNCFESKEFAQAKCDLLNSMGKGIYE